MSEEKKILRKVDHQAGDGHADYLFWCPDCTHGLAGKVLPMEAF